MTKRILLANGSFVCGVCAANLSSSDAQCPICGEKQVGEVTGRVCAACGGPVVGAEVKCSHCGVLPEDAETPDEHQISARLAAGTGHYDAARSLFAELQRREDAVSKREVTLNGRMDDLRTELKSLGSDRQDAEEDVKAWSKAVKEGLDHLKKTLTALIKHFDGQENQSAKRSAAVLKTALKVLDDLDLNRIKGTKKK